MNKIKEFNEVVVHCQYGKCRSPAVGLFLSKNIKESTNIDINLYPDINTYVLNYLNNYKSI